MWLYALDLRQLPADPERDQAFKERAQALQGIRHFTLPTLLEADARDGWQWAAFAPVPGISLRDQLGGHGPLDPTQAALLLHDIGSTLKALRLQGVHGMLDVSSIHLNANKRLRCLLDFGISKLFDIVPSPHFCRAPEQWNNPRHASESTDIYAAAVIAWEAIAGDEPGALSGGDPYREKRFRQRIPALRVVREDVHEELSNLIFEWTSHDESERPKTWISALILLGSVLYELNDTGSRHPTAELLSAEDSEPPTRPNSETQRRRALLPPPVEHADTLPAPPTKPPISSIPPTPRTAGDFPKTRPNTRAPAFLLLRDAVQTKRFAAIAIGAALVMSAGIFIASRSIRSPAKQAVDSVNAKALALLLRAQSSAQNTPSSTAGDVSHNSQVTKVEPLISPSHARPRHRTRKAISPLDRFDPKRETKGSMYMGRQQH